MTPKRMTRKSWNKKMIKENLLINLSVLVSLRPGMLLFMPNLVSFPAQQREMAAWKKHVWDQRTCIHRDAINPLCVAKVGGLKKELISTQRNGAARLRQKQLRIKLVYVLIGRGTNNSPFELSNFSRRPVSSRRFNGHPRLQIALTIKVGCLHKGRITP